MDEIKPIEICEVISEFDYHGINLNTEGNEKGKFIN